LVNDYKKEKGNHKKEKKFIQGSRQHSKKSYIMNDYFFFTFFLFSVYSKLFIYSYIVKNIFNDVI